jgi:hypothetical protein
MNWTLDLRSTATIFTMNALPIAPQSLAYVNKIYALHTNHGTAFLKRISANSASGKFCQNCQQTTFHITSTIHNASTTTACHPHHQPRSPCDDTNTASSEVSPSVPLSSLTWMLGDMSATAMWQATTATCSSQQHATTMW